ncbi:hypothetical protein SAMN05421858_4916 [Haladaptatus litoreus]|uniref:Uncharacterized protein n=1 Tax=Haladaptatus litoreus TaxID=553468 RepID=A0A1N7FC07_9EURY|nr:hypothetical protein [Haladaptatus litoreus]SIR97755.1 hypothetical protein SAMN05421858_4916 [Haladaptatus litoreus]
MAPELTSENDNENSITDDDVPPSIEIDRAEPSVSNANTAEQELPSRETMWAVIQQQAKQIDTLEEQVETLEHDRETAKKKRAHDRSRLSALEETTDEIQDDVDDLVDLEEKNARTRASITRIINLVRDYESADGVDDESDNLAAEASNVGRQLFETVQRSEQNTELMNFREKRVESQQIEDKYLAVLEAGQKLAAENETMIVRMNYRKVATHYGCAYKNDGYRVMEEMAERVPGVTYKESKNLGPETMGVGGRHIEISFAHPDLAGWMRAHEADTGGK